MHSLASISLSLSLKNLTNLTIAGVFRVGMGVLLVRFLFWFLTIT